MHLGTIDQNAFITDLVVGIVPVIRISWWIVKITPTAFHKEFAHVPAIAPINHQLNESHISITNPWNRQQTVKENFTTAFFVM